MTEKTTKKAAPKSSKTLKKNDTKAGDFSIIKTGGKQYIVSVGDILKIEKLPVSSKDGKVTFEEVLLTTKGDKVEIGNPLVKGGKVSAEILEEGKAKKVTVIKYKAKSNYFKKRGHRQPFVKIKIISI